MDDQAKINILVVDDEEAELTATNAVLGSPEYRIVTACSGKEALGKILEEDFALILMDVRMPGLNGFETAKIIKTHERARGIPIIFITGGGSDEFHAQEGYQAGAVDYLMKPFDAKILCSKVAVFVELYRKGQTIRRQAEQIRESERSKFELESLDRYRLRANAIPHVIWQASSPGVLDHVNKCWCDYTGKSLEASSRTGWQDCINPGDLAKFLAAWETAQGAGTAFEAECRIRRAADAAERWHLFQLVPETTKQGQIAGWVGAGTDIHDRKQLEIDLRKASQAAEAAAQLKTDFVATMSHEIRTPLNSILGMADVLAQTELDEQQRRYVEVFRRAGKSLLDIINDILDISKIEAGQMSLNVAPFDLREVLEEVSDIAGIFCRPRSLNYAHELAPEIQPVVVGDQVRVRQILVNLIGNAAKFTEKGEIRVRVGLVTPASARQRIRFSVEDTGIGIPKEKMELLFKKFSQADSTVTRRHHGTGLGLAISKHLSELMGGRIWCSSEEKVGSCFHLEIDLPKSSEALSAAPELDLGAIRVLVVERGQFESEVLRRQFQRWNARVETASSVAEAVDLAARASFDLYVVDCKLEDGGGFGLISRLGRDGHGEVSARTILMLPAGHRVSDLAHLKEIGIRSYFVKPIKASHLVRAVVETLGLKSAASPAARAGAWGKLEPEHPLRVLVAEDIADNEMVLRAYFKKTLCDVHYVQNGQEALSRFTKEHYDLVLMDIQMPVMDGYTATQAIRQWEKKEGQGPVPIIALTAHAFADERKKIHDAGCDGFLTKPLSRDDLMKTLVQFGEPRERKAI